MQVRLHHFLLKAIELSYISQRTKAKLLKTTFKPLPFLTWLQSLSKCTFYSLELIQSTIMISSFSPQNHLHFLQHTKFSCLHIYPFSSLFLHSSPVHTFSTTFAYKACIKNPRTTLSNSSSEMPLLTSNHSYLLLDLTTELCHYSITLKCPHFLFVSGYKLR